LVVVLPLRRHGDAETARPSPVGAAADLLTVAHFLAGVAIFLYLAGAVVELIARAVGREHLGEGREKGIGQLRDHTIICGFGSVARSCGSEAFDTYPDPDVVLGVGGRLIGVDSPGKILRLEELFVPGGVRGG
jgi:hypothetical protein